MMMQKKNLIESGAKTRGKLNIMCEVEPNQHADLEAFGRKGAEKVTRRIVKKYSRFQSLPKIL